MSQFFGLQYSQEDLQQRLAERRSENERQRQMGTMAQQQQQEGDEMDMTGLLSGDSLNDIIMQNNREIQRRQSMTQPFPEQHLTQGTSILDFGVSNNGLTTYQFAPTTGAGSPLSQDQSLSALDMSNYRDMGQGMSMTGPQLGFNLSLQTSDPLVVDTSVYQGMSTEMGHGMMPYSPLTMEGISAGSSGMNMFSQEDFSQQFSSTMDPMNNQFMMPGMQPPQNMDEDGEDLNSTIPAFGNTDSINVTSPLNMSLKHNSVDYNSPSTISSQTPHITENSSYNLTTTTTSPVQKNSVVAKVKQEPPPSPYKNIYSQSGFDMIGAFIKIANRRDPEINIGKVDLSCAFVVCDVTQHDCPIIYVSEIFERLTGYTKYEVLGRNCRFLQSPDGKVQAGARREFVDNDSVHYLSEKIRTRKEAQHSLINYRKGGQPFMNLLTMIPITGEDDKEIKYYVGFQVDLVEKPASVESKGINGMYVVDYTQGSLPKYEWKPPESVRGDIIQATRDEVGSVLSAMQSSPESEITKGQWDKVLLENTDDVVHVISLKGLFLYLSPSCRTVLEYDATELTGTALSSICHPSDIVPVTRELKDTTNGVAVSIVFRIRRKRSGYTWFESHGSLHVEQGKGRKFIILVGRERPVYALARRDLDAAAGIGENEIWSKLSTSGMFLFVASNVRTLLDRAPENLVGTSIQQLMRSESKVEFGRCLEKSRTGKRITYKHEVLNKRGLTLQAQTTLYPGDAFEGSKPTFLVAQTRLLKPSTRAAAPSIVSQNSGSKAMSSLGKNPRPDDSDDLGGSIVSTQSIQDIALTPRSSISYRDVVTEAGSAGLAVGSQDRALASEENIFDELKTTRCTSWQFELRQMEKSNRLLADELASLLSNKKKRKRRRGTGHLQRDCANCHTRVTPEWRRGPSGQRDLCNSCGLRWAKQTGRVSPRTGGSKASQKSTSPLHTSSAMQKDLPTDSAPNLNSNFNLKPGTKTAGAGDGCSAPISAGSGGRTTSESMPVHRRSVGFREGGERGITNIGEGIEDEGEEDS